MEVFYMTKFYLQFLLIFLDRHQYCFNISANRRKCKSRKHMNNSAEKNGKIARGRCEWK